MSEVTSIVAGEVTRLALCWRLRRRDGVTIGLTSAARAIERDGLRYAAAPGMSPSAISSSDGFDVDSMTVDGLLSAAALSAEDVAAGRWADAQVELFAVDWSRPDSPAIALTAGTIGAISQAATGSTGWLRAELHGPTMMLAAAGPPVCSPTCRARLGDLDCGVDMDVRRMDARVRSVDGATLRLEQALPDPSRFSFGRVRVLSGPAAGLSATIAGADADRLTLNRPWRMPVEPGARVRVWEGCDRHFSTCVARFRNAEAFRGEPHVPGADALQRYD